MNSEDRALGCFMGLAIGDALGAPVEFRRRGSFPEIREMHAGGYFKLPAGAWTDDTAMALCLADSLLHVPELDAADLLNRFLRWIDMAENTSTGRCIGVGQNTFEVLSNFRKTGALVAPKMRKLADGNGALMRLAPVACVHWKQVSRATKVGAAQSRTTHASDLSSAACGVLAGLLSQLIAGDDWVTARQQAGSGDLPSELATIFHDDLTVLPEARVSSSGYVIHTLQAALWAVETTTCFENALIRAVNLGDDADTVGAVAGQLAGARYGYSAIPERWRNKLVKHDHLYDTACRLYSASDSAA